MSKTVFLSCAVAFNLSLTNVNATDSFPKVIGGASAKVDAWPWMAGIVHNDKLVLDVFCGASLIDKDWVLTAAHCVMHEDVNNLAVIIGRSDLKSTRGDYITVEKVLLHPAFNRVEMKNDIALLKLSHSSSITPVETLPDFSNLDEAGHKAIALGWGMTSQANRTFSETLQQVTLPIISNGLCNHELGGISDNMLCAGSSGGGKDTCEGDSGGPLLVYDSQRKAWRQAGITSFGVGPCARAGSFGVYTRLDGYKEFISRSICLPQTVPEPPKLTVSVAGNQVTASWTSSDRASAYRLNYAEYPIVTTINSIEMNQNTTIAAELPVGTAMYLAVSAYQGNCRSEFSNIEHFVVQ